jgi:hypothetical protein
MVSSSDNALATSNNATYHLEVLSASPGPKIFQIKDLMTSEETDHIIRVRRRINCAPSEENRQRERAG